MNLEKRLQGISLDMPARIGATVFHKGVSVYEVIERAQREYSYLAQHKADAEPGEHKKATDPWITEAYAITTQYHKQTGKKVVIGDLLEAAMVDNLKEVTEDDRGWFMERLKERLA